MNRARFEEILNGLAGENPSDDLLTTLAELRGGVTPTDDPTFSREQVYGDGERTWKEMYEESQQRYRDRFLGRIDDGGNANLPPAPPAPPNPVSVPGDEDTPTIDSLFTDV